MCVDVCVYRTSPSIVRVLLGQSDGGLLNDSGGIEPGSVDRRNWKTAAFDDSDGGSGDGASSGIDIVLLCRRNAEVQLVPRYRLCYLAHLLLHFSARTLVFALGEETRNHPRKYPRQTSRCTNEPYKEESRTASSV